MILKSIACILCIERRHADEQEPELAAHFLQQTKKFKVQNNWAAAKEFPTKQTRC